MLSNGGLGMNVKKRINKGLVSMYMVEAWGMRSAERRVNVLEIKNIHVL